MKQSQEESSKQIRREFDQSHYEDQQGQYQSSHLHKDNLLFASVEKAVFINLRKIKQQQIQSILFGQPTNLVSSKKILQADRLISYLKKIQRPNFSIQTQTFRQAFSDLKSIFSDQITNIWRKLSKQQRDKYEQIGMKNRTMMEQLEDQQSGDKYSGYEMLKIDVLCVFFLYNNYFVKACEHTIRLLFSPDFLTRVFDLDLRYISKMSHKFKQHEREIYIDYRQELHSYVELFLLIKLAYRLKNYTKRTRSSLSSIPSVKVQLNVNIASQIYSSKDAKLQFSQIAYKSIAKMLRIRKSARFTLQASVQTINYQRQKLLIEISKEYQISYHILLEMNSKMDKDRYISKQQFVAYFEKNLLKCQWIFLKGESSLIEGINAAFGNTFTDSTIYCGDGRIGFKSFLTKLALKRFELLSTIFKMQVQLEQKLAIYVYRFQYCLSDFCSNKQKIGIDMNQSSSEDLKCSLIILVVNSQILACTFCRNLLSHNKYLCLVKLCSKLIQKNYTKQFNLVLYQFDAQHTIHTEVFTFFQIYMDKHFGSRVYMVNDPQLFRPHFLVDSFLRSFLSKLNLNKQNFYWYFEVCTNKLLKGIQRFDKRTNEDYFAYFEKIMNVQMEIRDVWKCFKKDRGNRYNAVILGRGDFEEECPGSYLVMLEEQVPSQQWFRSVQYCQPSLQDFTSLQERENWRIIEPYTEDDFKDFEGFLQRKHIKENCIRRILKDVTKFLIDYQLFFVQLVHGKRKIKQGLHTVQTLVWLRDFYEQQNKNMELVYSQRQAIFEQSAKKYDKVKKVNKLKEDLKQK